MEKERQTERPFHLLGFIGWPWERSITAAKPSALLVSGDLLLCASKDRRAVFASPALHPAKPFVVLNRPRSTLITYTLNCANKQLEHVLI